MGISLDNTLYSLRVLTAVLFLKYKHKNCTSPLLVGGDHKTIWTFPLTPRCLVPGGVSMGNKWECLGFKEGVIDQNVSNSVSLKVGESVNMTTVS